MRYYNPFRNSTPISDAAWYFSNLQNQEQPEENRSEQIDHEEKEKRENEEHMIGEEDT